MKSNLKYNKNLWSFICDKKFVQVLCTIILVALTPCSGQVTEKPTGEPSGQPTSKPTYQPSSNPTLAAPVDLTFYGGGNNTSPVKWNPNSLGFVNSGSGTMRAPLYLTVDVWPTHFEDMGLQWAEVKVNDITVNLYCTPDEECGTEFFTCLSDMDVSNYIQEHLGGSITVEVASSGVPHGVCNHLGYSLYVRMLLREKLPTHESTRSIPIWIFIAFGLLLFLLLLLCLLLCNTIFGEKKEKKTDKVFDPKPIVEKVPPPRPSSRTSPRLSPRPSPRPPARLNVEAKVFPIDIVSTKVTSDEELDIEVTKKILLKKRSSLANYELDT